MNPNFQTSNRLSGLLWAKPNVVGRRPEKPGDKRGGALLSHGESSNLLLNNHHTYDLFPVIFHFVTKPTLNYNDAAAMAALGEPGNPEQPERKPRGRRVANIGYELEFDGGIFFPRLRQNSMGAC